MLYLQEKIFLEVRMIMILCSLQINTLKQNLESLWLIKIFKQIFSHT